MKRFVKKYILKFGREIELTRELKLFIVCYITDSSPTVTETYRLLNTVDFRDPDKGSILSDLFNNVLLSFPTVSVWLPRLKSLFTLSPYILFCLYLVVVMTVMSQGLLKGPTEIYVRRSFFMHSLLYFLSFNVTYDSFEFYLKAEGAKLSRIVFGFFIYNRSKCNYCTQRNEIHFVSTPFLSWLR